MGAFRDTAQLEDVIGTLFQSLFDDPEIRSKFLATGMTLQFVMTDPDGVIAITRDGVNTGERKPVDVTMTMKADTAHAFWLGEITLPRALSRGDIVTDKPVTRILGLLPLLKPAYKMYPKLARSRGVEV